MASLIAINAGRASNTLSCVSGTAASKPEASPSVKRQGACYAVQHTAGVVRTGHSPGRVIRNSQIGGE